MIPLTEIYPEEKKIPKSIGIGDVLQYKSGYYLISATPHERVQLTSLQEVEDTCNSVAGRYFDDSEVSDPFHLTKNEVMGITDGMMKEFILIGPLSDPAVRRQIWVDEQSEDYAYACRLLVTLSPKTKPTGNLTHVLLQIDNFCAGLIKENGKQMECYKSALEKIRCGADNHNEYWMAEVAKKALQNKG